MGSAAKRYLVIITAILLPVVGFGQQLRKQVVETLRPYVMKEAAWAMTQQPITVTSEHSNRSAGGRHDFFSEGDYWWPNPKSIDSPYIQKDGLTNPQNFVAHRQAMIRFSRIIGALGSAYKLTDDKKYALEAEKHLRAWFIDTATLMNPNLLYAQAIKGVATGRGIGIIDAIQLMEVVQGVEVMQSALSPSTVVGMKSWFTRYLAWVTTHKYGLDEMNAKNNHGTCWVMQVACFAKFTGDKKLLEMCTERYQNVLIPTQMVADGGFPLELKRTKAYGYSIFDLDAMATICQILSTPTNNLWAWQTTDGRGIKKGIAFLYPYLADKTKWPYPHDVMHWDDWPVAQPSLVFGAVAYGNTNWLNTWKMLNHAPTDEEVIRNLPVRHPLLWLN